MKKLSVALLGAVALYGRLAAAQIEQADIQVAKTDQANLEVGGMAQMLGEAENVNDPYKNNNRIYLFNNEARLFLAGGYQDYSFYMQLALGGEDAVNATTGVDLSMLDFAFRIPIHALGNSSLQVGQFLVPYGRENLTYSGSFVFTQPSIDYNGFKVGHDVGAAVTLKPGNFTLIGGVFTGGGRDVPPFHELPEVLGIPELVARIGYGTLEEDNYWLKQTDLSHTASTARWAVHVNGLFTQDSRLGHSTVLNIKLADKSLLIDSDWNPYIGKGPFSQGSYWQMGGDFAVRGSTGPVALAGEAEIDWGGYSNDYGVLHLAGGRIQGSATWQHFEVALRYAVLFPDKSFSYAGVPITGTAPMNEITPALSWYFYGEHLKLVADLPIQLNVPVFTENDGPNAAVGSYVGTELPDESTVLSGKLNTVTHQNVVMGRLLFQAAF